jgi:hypothetical protein
MPSYLAQHYLTTDPPQEKKKKGKRDENLHTIGEMGNTLPPVGRKPSMQQDEEDLSQQAQIIGEVIQKKLHIPCHTLWKLAVKSEDETPPPKINDEGGPCTTAQGANNLQLMGGLHTVQELKAAGEASKKAEKEDMQRLCHSAKFAKAQETIYRDATGERQTETHGTERYIAQQEGIGTTDRIT